MPVVKSLKIGARRFTVVDWAHHEANDENARGDCNTRTGVIRISDGYPPDVRAEAIIHEIMHAIICEAGVDMDHDAEEAMVARLAPWVAAVLADNENAVHELLDMLAGPA